MKHTLTFLKKIATLLLLTFVVLTSCDDQTGNIGIDIMPQPDHTTTSQALFKVKTSSIKVDSMVAYTSDCYLGRVTDPETGATTTSDFMAQFATLENDDLPPLSAMHKEDGQVVADSIMLNLYIKSYYGDSVNSMKLGIYELDPQNILPENKNYYTNIDPTEYINKSADAINLSTSFAVTDLSIDDTIRFASNYSKNIRIKLPASYGTSILQKYYQHPEYFKNSYSFIRNVVPGFYFKTLSGNGTMVNIDISTLTIYFRYDIKDSTYVGIKRVATTEEVIQSNVFSNKDLTPLMEAKDYTFVKSPVALLTEVEIPVNAICQSHENDSINSAKIVFMRKNNDSQTSYSLAAPKTLLMLRKKDLGSYFEQRQVPDNITSYTTRFSNDYNSYTFSNIANLITYLRNERNRGAGIIGNESESEMAQKISAWETANPNWNKMVLVPVTTESNSSGSIIDVYNDMSLSSVKLVGGADSPITMTVVYSSFQK